MAETDMINRAREEEDATIDLVELLYKLLENLRYILAIALLCAIAAGVYTLGFVTPLYEATAKLYVLSSKDSAINLSDLQIGSYLTSDYQEVFHTWEVHEAVLQNLGLEYSYTQLESMLKISNPSDTRILHITVTSDDPKLSMSMANEYAKVAKRYISDTMATDEPNILSVALEPKRPSSPSKTRNVMLGFILGAMATVAIIVVRLLIDDKIKTEDDIAKYGNMPTLAVIPVMKTLNAQKSKFPSFKRRENVK